MELATTLEDHPTGYIVAAQLNAQSTWSRDSGDIALLSHFVACWRLGVVADKNLS